MESAHASSGTLQSNLSESDFLRLEAEKSKASLADSLGKAKSALVHGVDPRVPFVPLQRHPNIALLAAATVGFVTTVVTVPSKRERELRELERINRALHPQPAAPLEAQKPSDGAPEATVRAGLLAYIIKEILAFARPILIAQITSRLKNESKPVEPPAPL